MNDAQTLFSIFFGIYFAIVSTLSGVLLPFETPAMYKWNGKAWLRFFTSILMLNIIPILYFSLVYNILNCVKEFQVNFYSIFFVFSLSIVYFGFYRIYYGLMLIQKNKKYFFYKNGLLPESLKNDLVKRGEDHIGPAAHIIPGIIWTIIAFSIGYFGLAYI